MHKLSFLVSAALSAVALAQSPLTTIFANNNSGNIGGGVYFDLTPTVPIAIQSLDMNFNSPATTAGTVEVWVLPGTTRAGNQTNQGLWTMAATGTTTSAGPGLPSPVVLSNPVPLGTGVNGITLVARTGVSHAYTNGTGGNQNYSTLELALAAGEASNAAFLAPLFAPRVVNCSIYYSTGGGGTFATKVRYGTGGGGSNASLYEMFVNPATFDLNGRNFQFTEQAGGGWSVANGSAAVSAAAALPLALTDDSEVAQPLSSGFAPSVQVCSNGFISIGSNGTSFTPDVPLFLNAAFESWRVWHDFNPAAAGSGQVKYQFVGGEDVITWDGVYDFAGPNPNTLQFRLSVAGGQRRVVISIVTMSGLGNSILLGYSPAGVSVDPGSTDLSAATLPIGLGATDVGPVVLDADVRPVLGTTCTLTTTNIPAGSLGVATQFSALQNLLGLDLGFIGAPGNRFYLGSIDGSFGVATLPIGVPNNLALNGAFIYWQSAVVKLGVNPLNVLTSNGLSLKLGNL